jgi:hypothetical protein
MKKQVNVFLLAVCMALAVVVVAQSIWPYQSPPNNRGQPTVAENQNGNPDRPVTDPAAKENPSEGKQKGKWYDTFLEHPAEWLIAIFNGLLVYVTYRLVTTTGDLRESTDRLWEAGERQIAVAKQSADAAAKSAKVAEDSMFVGHRPYVYVTMVKFDRDFDPKKFDYEGEPIWPFIDIVVENHGVTPATIVQVCADSACIAELPKQAKYRTNTIYGATKMVIPSKSKVTLTYLFKTPIDGEVMNDIGVGTAIPSLNGRNLYSYGIVKFEDVFGFMNEVGFCFRYNVDLKYFHPETDSAYEYHYVERRYPVSQEGEPDNRIWL